MKHVAWLIVLFSISYQSHGQTLSGSDMKELELKALAGSGSSAQKLAEYHFKNNDLLFEYWSCIGAENGNNSSQHNCGSMLFQKKNAYLRLRGIFWLKKAAQGGNQFSKDQLKELKPQAP